MEENSKVILNQHTHSYTLVLTKACINKKNPTLGELWLTAYEWEKQYNKNERLREEVGITNFPISYYQSCGGIKCMVSSK